MVFFSGLFDTILPRSQFETLTDSSNEGLTSRILISSYKLVSIFSQFLMFLKVLYKMHLVGFIFSLNFVLFC